MSENDKPRVLICILTTYERTGWICKELGEWLEHLRYQGKYTTAVGYAHNFSSAAAARNFLCDHVRKVAMEDRPDWILMIDNDMVPDESLLTCIDHAPEDAGVICPRFYMWDPNKCAPILCWGVEDPQLTNGHAEVLNIENGKHKYYQLTKAGTGATFIRPQLLDDIGDIVFNDYEKVPATQDTPVQASPGLFFYTFNDKGARLSTEDIAFCLVQVPKTKWKIYGYADVEVGHYHNVNLAQVAKWIYTQETKKAEMETPLECFR